MKNYVLSRNTISLKLAIILFVVFLCIGKTFAQENKTEKQKGGLSNEELYRKKKPTDPNAVPKPIKDEVKSKKPEEAKVVVPVTPILLETKIEMKALNNAIEYAGALENKSKIELKNPKDNCELEYLEHKVRDAAFVKSNAATIQWIHNQLSGHLTEQQTLINNYKLGIVEGQPKELFKSLDGTEHLTTVLTLRHALPDGANAKVSVIELFKLIEKYNLESSQVVASGGNIDDLMVKYNDPLNFTKAEYFGLTLSVAARAYKQLGNSFSVTKTQAQSRSLETGSGANLFLVTFTNRFTRDPVTGAKILSKVTGKNGETFSEVTIAKPLREVMNQVTEQDVYDICRNLQISIQVGNGPVLPIDGLLRAEEFEKFRSLECKNRYVFKAPVAGPMIDYKTEEINCNVLGIRIKSAIATGGNGQTYVFTDAIKREADGKHNYTTQADVTSIIPASFGYGCGSWSFTITYVCGCDDASVPGHFKGAGYGKFYIPCP